ncbi:hypothetical protein BGZ47_000605 [Haplosporangium gracile]|nr:hypothetical protein BGZ47_000605 [Haplosporangium gracile]
MHVTKSTLLAALFLAIVQAQQIEQQGNQAAFGANQQATAATNTESNDQQNQQSKPTQQQVESPQKLPSEEFEMAKDRIRQILGQLPIQHVEPLVNTMEGYCTTFGALCTAACKGRMVDDDEEEVQGSTRIKTALSLGCANPKALTIGAAGASCHVGGIVTSRGKKSGDFGAGRHHIPPTSAHILIIIHVLQSICYYISFFDVLATNTHPPSCPADGKPSGIMGTITGLAPGLGNIIPTIPGIGGLLDGLLGTGGGGSEPAPTRLLRRAVAELVGS